MADPITIAVLGCPVPYSKTTYTPAKQKAAMEAIGWAAKGEMSGRAMLDGPLKMAFRAEMPIPRSWSNRKKNAAILGLVLPVGKPDLANLIKLAEDAMTGIVYADDALICEYDRPRKVYGKQPKLVLTVMPLVV